MYVEVMQSHEDAWYILTLEFVFGYSKDLLVPNSGTL